MSSAAFQSFIESPLARRMLELSPAAEVVFDRAGNVVFFNDKLTQLLGYTSAELMGCSSQEFLPNILTCDQLAHQARPLSQAGIQETGIEKNINARSKTGLSIPVIAILHEMTGTRGPLWLVHVLRANSQALDRDRMELARLEAIGEVVTGLAHESRNALQRALASLDLLELDLGHNPDNMMLSQRIRRSLADLLANYDEVRRYAEPITIKIQSVKLFRVCQLAFSEVLGDKVVRPHQLIPPSEGDDTVQADSHGMKTVFYHVLDNAIDAAGDAAARIEFKLQRLIWRNVESVKLELRDHGTGFNANSLRQAFQPFYTTKQRGTGLGLAICRRIVEAHHGEIHASNASDGGAIVEISMPTNCLV